MISSCVSANRISRLGRTLPRTGRAKWEPTDEDRKTLDDGNNVDNEQQKPIYTSRIDFSPSRRPNIDRRVFENTDDKAIL